jgi:preprotein translocase subunit SecE
MGLMDQIQQNAARRQQKKKKTGGLKGFFKGVWSELKKVHWPTRKELVSYTGVVVFAVLLMALAISAFDWIISTLINLVLDLS